MGSCIRCGDDDPILIFEIGAEDSGTGVHVCYRGEKPGVNKTKPDTGKVNIAVDLAATDAGSSDANQAVQMKEWFNTGSYPKATFSASQFKPLGGGKFSATGQFSVKGKTANLTVPFTVKPDAKGSWYEGSFPLSRLAWKIGEGEWSDVGAVADAVQVKFKLYVAK